MVPIARSVSGTIEEPDVIDGIPPAISPPDPASSVQPVQVGGREEEHRHSHNQQQQAEEEEERENQQQRTVTYRVNITISDWASTDTMDEAWTCLIVLVILYFLVSITVILGFYGAEDLRLGPNRSHLIQANSFFVNDIKVQEVSGPEQGPVLYGFYGRPPLDVETSWSESYNVSLSANSHKDWVYFLNQGSEVDIMYTVKSSDASPLSLVIAQGKQSFMEWMEDPSYPDITLSWSFVHGSGKIQQKIYESSDYYVALGNLNQEELEVELDIKIRALLYNTTDAYYKCSITHGPCSLKLSLMGESVGVLSSSDSEQGVSSVDWFVKVSYEPRWITYVVASGVMTVLLFLIFKLCVKLQSTGGSEVGGRVQTERSPLLAQKDDDQLSLGSSYDSISNDEEDLEDLLAVGSIEAKSLKEGETKNPRRVCSICFDYPRDCFFLPCGHCAACYACGSRTADNGATCPVCHRIPKKVRKIFAV